MTQRRKPPSSVDKKTSPVPAAVRRGKSRTVWRFTMAAIAVVVIGAVVWALWLLRPETRSRSALEAAKTVPPDPVTPDMEVTVADVLRRARDAVLRDPMSSDSWGRLGALCDAHDLNDCAETCYERAYELGRDDLMLVYNLGVVYELRGRPDDALAMLQRAQKMEPSFPGTYWRLGELYAREGRFEAAREAFSRALAIEPTHLLALRGLGSVLIQLGDVEAALEPLEQVAAAAPGDGPTFAHLARVYARLGRTKDAEVALEQSRRLSSASPLVLADPIRFEIDRLRLDSISLRERAEAQVRSRDFPGAVDTLQLLLRDQPDATWPNTQMGRVLVLLGRTREALPFFERARRLAPDDANACFDYGFALEQSGNLEQARQEYHRAVELVPGHRAGERLERLER